MLQRDAQSGRFDQNIGHFRWYPQMHVTSLNVSDHITKEEECPFGSSISKLFKFSSSSKNTNMVT